VLFECWASVFYSLHVYTTRDCVTNEQIDGHGLTNICDAMPLTTDGDHPRHISPINYCWSRRPMSHQRRGVDWFPGGVYYKYQISLKEHTLAIESCRYQKGSFYHNKTTIPGHRSLTDHGLDEKPWTHEESNRRSRDHASFLLILRLSFFCRPTSPSIVAPIIGAYCS